MSINDQWQAALKFDMASAFGDEVSYSFNAGASYQMTSALDLLMAYRFMLSENELDDFTYKLTTSSILLGLTMKF